MRSFFLPLLIGSLPPILGQTLCDQYSTISNNGFTISNNIWGEDQGTGFSCITQDWVSDAIAWHTDWQWSGNDSVVKSYPNVQLDLPQKRIVSQISNMPTIAVWNYAGNDLRADVAYDLFTASDPNHPTYYGDFELMIWLGNFGKIGPIGSLQGQVSIDSQTWLLYYGLNGHMQVYSFVAPSTMYGWNGDVKSFYSWLASNKGYPINSQYLLSFQFGTEPFTGSGNTFHVLYWKSAVN